MSRQDGAPEVLDPTSQAQGPMPDILDPTPAAQGLTSGEVEELRRRGKANLPDQAANTSVSAIVAANVLTYFNAIFVILATLLLSVGKVRDLTFMPVVVANTVIGIVQQLRARRVLDELALLDASSYEVLRDGEPTTVPSEGLVQGDVIRLRSGQQVPADALVVSGGAQLNESLVTGEADEVERGVGDSLMSGSYLVAGEVMARLVRVGHDSYAGQLTSRAKALDDRPSEMIRDIDRIILVAGLLIVPVAVLLLWQATGTGAMPYPDAVSSMVGAVIGMIPEGLYLLVSIALALSAMRLARQRVLFHDMRSIETLARVDVLCVDKTGTITSDGMSLAEVFGPGDATADIEEARELLARYVATVPDENATIEALRTSLPPVAPLDAVSVRPFSSRRKYSEVGLAGETLRLGAPDFLLDGEGLKASAKAIGERVGRGGRVLALVRVRNGRAEPLVFACVANEVRPDARETFATFARQGVEVKVISGDDARTVSRVASDAGIAGSERACDVSALTGTELREAACMHTVFGRVLPEQKRELVAALRASGRKVAMVGDGVNDILAMREADCSIAMGGGSDAARQAAQVVLLDSDFSHMGQIVSEGRRNINNITRSATLFLYKNLFSLALALFSLLGSLSYPLSAAQVTLVSFCNIGVPAFFLAFEPNEERQRGRFVTEVVVRSLPAAICAFLGVAALMVLADPCGMTQDDVATGSTILLSLAGYLVLIGLILPPNRYRMGVLLGSVAVFVGLVTLIPGLFGMRMLSGAALAPFLAVATGEMATLLLARWLVGWVRQRLSA